MNRHELELIIEQRRYPDKEKRELLAYSALLVFVLYIAFLINTVILSSVYVDGISMYPTLNDGDVLYINKLHTPERGDIIVLNVAKDRAPFIKRVIGLEGDVLKCFPYEGKYVLKIKYAGTDSYASLPSPEDGTDTLVRTSMYYELFNTGELAVGKNEIFFMGDNRDDSEDSRVHGLRRFEDVIGVVPDWALKNKGIIYKIHNIFRF